MNDMLLKLYIRIRDLISQEEGQDLVEYALVASLIALACTAGMRTLATALGNEFTIMGTSVSNAF